MDCDWFESFLEVHTRNFLRHDWPEGEENYLAYFRNWKRWFLREGVTEAEAMLATEALTARPPKFRDDHLPELMAWIRTHRERARRESHPDKPAATEVSQEELEIEAHWESLGEDARRKWLDWGREHFPALSEDSKLIGTYGERCGLYLAACTRRAAWDSSQGRTPKVPTRIVGNLHGDRSRVMRPEKVEPPPDLYRQADEAREKFRAAMRTKGGGS